MVIPADQTTPSSDVRGTAERFKRLYTALVYDILDEAGFPNQCLDLAIRPLDRNMVVAGPAFTVFGGPDPRTDAEYPEDPKVANFGLFDALTDACIIVIASGGERVCGHFGELMSNAAKVRGASGVVIDGGIRDSKQLFEIEDWGVFVRYTSPIESDLRHRVRELQVPIAMSGTLTSQVRVEPGDWIFGDLDGVIVVPRDFVGEVLAKAEEAKRIEDLVRAEIRSGVPVGDVHRKYGRL
jgi:regulator of RNase E activity RraA